MPTNEGFARLGEAVKNRRGELGMSQADVMKAGGPSDTTQSKIELGVARKVGAQTLAKYDRALQWQTGTARALLSGPVDLALPPQPAPGVEPPVARIRAPLVLDEGTIPTSLALVLAEAAADMERAASDLEDISYDENEPEEFDAFGFEIAQSDVTTAAAQVAAIADELGVLVFGGRAQFQIAVERERRRRRRHQQIFELMPQANRWPDGQPVTELDSIEYNVWRNSGRRDWRPYRDMAPVERVAIDEGKYEDLPSAARTVPGPTDAEKRHAAQDAAAEAPDEDGPDGGA